MQISGIGKAAEKNYKKACEIAGVSEVTNNIKFLYNSVQMQVTAKTETKLKDSQRPLRAKY